jgi:hypothetical protein
MEPGDVLAVALECSPAAFPPLVLGPCAGTCRAARRQALVNAADMLALLGPVVNNTSWAAAAKLPAGAFARLHAARLLEGLSVAVPVGGSGTGWGFTAAEAARVSDRLHALGATVLRPTCAALVQWMDTEGEGAAPRLDFWVSQSAVVQGLPPFAPWVWAETLEAFLFSPWVHINTTHHSSGAELSLAGRLELLHNFNCYHGGEATETDMQKWTRDSHGPVNFQDLSLRTHLNICTGDVVREWNYGMGDNDFGTYSFVPSGAPPDASFPAFLTNYDGDRSLAQEGGAAGVPPLPLSHAELAALEGSDSERALTSSDEENPATAEAEEPEPEPEPVPLGYEFGSDTARAFATLRCLYASEHRFKSKRKPPLDTFDAWQQDWSRPPPAGGAACAEYWREHLRQVASRAAGQPETNADSGDDDEEPDGTVHID